MARGAARFGLWLGLAQAAALAGACDRRPLPLAGAGDPVIHAGVGDGGASHGDAGGDATDGGRAPTDAAVSVVRNGSHLAVGDDFTCALRTDHSIACWGLNGNGQATPPAGTFDTISAGAAFACALRPDGTPVCWGRNQEHQATPPAGTFTRISAGDRHACALRDDGTLACWGDNQSGEASPPPGAFLDVACGSALTLAVRRDGTLTSWGVDHDALQKLQLPWTFASVGARRRRLCALSSGGAGIWWNVGDDRVSTVAMTMTAIGAGADFACGLDGGGHINCWSELPTASGPAGARPPAGTFKEISIGATHSCAIGSGGASDSVGTITCWGDSAIVGRAPLAGGYRGVSVAGAGGIVPEELTHGCAWPDDGPAACWGYEGADHQAASPPPGRFSEISVGLIHTCALDASGVVTCWGDRQYGEGDSPPGPFARIAAGFATTCGIGVSGSLSCWGRGAADSAPVTAAAPFSALALGYDGGCAVGRDGQLACWGSGPTAPTGRFQAVAVGSRHACAIRGDGTLTCWGGNDFGESSPPGGAYAAVAVGDGAGGGGGHSCALAGDGRVVCWGDRAYGKIAPPAAERFTQISSAESYSCATSTRGQIWCWGLHARQPL